MDRRERLGIYRTHFTVSKEVLEKDIVEMVFNGLDTYATIFINDYQVLSTENFHRFQSPETTKQKATGRFHALFL